MAGFDVNLDRRGVGGNAPGAIVKGGANAVNQARNQRNQAFQNISNTISGVVNKRRQQNDALTNIETIGGWDLELKRREGDLDPLSPSYEKDYDEMVGEIVDLDPDKFQTSDGLAAAQRAAESFRNSARVQAFDNAQEAMIARRDTTVKQLVNTAANRAMEQPDNADAYLTEVSMALSGIDMTDQERDAVSMATASAVLEAKHRGLIQQNRFKDAEQVEQEAIELWSHDTFVKRDKALDVAIERKKAEVKALKNKKDAESRTILQAKYADLWDGILHNDRPGSYDVIQDELYDIEDRIRREQIPANEVKFYLGMAATFRNELETRDREQEAKENAAEMKARKMREATINQHLNNTDVALKQSEGIQDPRARAEVQDQIVTNLSGLLESEKDKALNNKVTAVLKRAVDAQTKDMEARHALQRIESAAKFGLGSSQADVDMAADYLGSADPESAFTSMVELSKQARTMPSKLRVMYRTAGDDAQSLGMMAQVGRELEEELVPLPENARVTMTQAYAETQGIPYEQAAQTVVQNAPTEQETKARREYWRSGRAIGVDFRDMATVQELGEDMFDQSWFWDPEVSQGFLMDAERAHEVAWTMSGDPEMTKETAERMLRKRWGYSEATGRVQKMPVDRFVAAKMSLPGLHPNLGEAIMVQMAEDLMEAGVTIPASADRRRGSKARHGDVQRWEENAYDGVPFRPMWDAESEQIYRNTGEQTWAIQTLNSNGTWYAETTTEGRKLRWGVAGIDLTTFPKGEGEEYKKRLRKALDWNSARAYR